ncbi:MAG: L,D-transpeptidase [Elusimicrobia bacterium]|nr:L,D-transpeptidase [Elusimicrobiota bacterium]
MTLESALRRLSRQASPWAVAVSGAAILVGMHLAGTVLRDHTNERLAVWRQLATARDRAVASAGELQVLNELKARDVRRLKDALTQTAQSKRTLYEAGLALQEEKRLLEKQWEIMITYLMVDPTAQRLSVMRGEQALESFAVAYASAAFGAESRPLPQVSAIASKERFAHPERGHSEEQNGQLVWIPPQVGTSVRANALGESVMFFKNGPILHGPPKRREDHYAYPHWCVGLSAAAARKLYQHSFIGTKIVFRRK